MIAHITPLKVASDGTEALVFKVRVEDSTGQWNEIISGRSALDWFLRGLRCAAVTAGTTYSEEHREAVTINAGRLGE